MSFAQIVVGPPGSGKTTYCDGMHQFLNAVGRKAVVVNLDPANDNVPYPCAVSIQDLITVEEVMEAFELGPNGALLYCMEHLEKNMDWLYGQIQPHQGSYLIFDFPGQVELYTHASTIHNIVSTMQKWDLRLCAVHLVDSHYCSDATKFVSVLLVSLAAMVQLELPHINVLSKIDLIEKYGTLAFSLEYYADVLDLEMLMTNLRLESPKDPFHRRHQKLLSAICELIEDYSLVGFCTLNVSDKQLMYNLLKAIDKANGYVFGSLDGANDPILNQIAASTSYSYNRHLETQEKYMDDGSGSLSTPNE
eukprot:TRINITY_DN4677_c0_g1_i5.p1 TRINITY_DN4677_c0_g1~~TRINITY_DN4677_c0_g1_i5.p1  ORF type:complete len:306 (+),score=45.10 TRINITY_DN4677_c0_g1_i5:60-977(+)